MQVAIFWEKKSVNIALNKSFFKLEFSPCTADQSLRGMESKEKEALKGLWIQQICLERTYS